MKAGCGYTQEPCNGCMQKCSGSGYIATSTSKHAGKLVHSFEIKLEAHSKMEIEVFTRSLNRQKLLVHHGHTRIRYVIITLSSQIAGARGNGKRMNDT